MRTALVVGGSSDIGRAIAVEVARRGLAVHAWGRDPERLALTEARCREAGAGEVTTTAVDLTDLDGLPDAVARVVATGELACVVWAAGLFDWAPADEADPATWARLLTVSLTAAAVVTAAVAPALVRHAPGSALVHIGSTAADQAFADNAAYVAAKHGLRGLALATFEDLRRHGVKVSLVSPGLVAAGAGLHSPQGRAHPDRLLQPADVAAAVGFVLDFPAHGCPTEIRLQPLLS